MGRGQRCCEILLGVSLLLGWENEISGRRGEGKISIHASCIWTTTKGFFQTPSFRGDNCTDDNTGIFWLLVTGFTKPIFLHSPLNLAHPQPRQAEGCPSTDRQQAQSHAQALAVAGEDRPFVAAVHLPATGTQSKQQLCFRRIEEPSVSTLLFSCPYHHCLSSPRRSKDISRPGDVPESWHGLPKTKLQLFKESKVGAVIF